MIQLYNKDKNKLVIIWTCFKDNSQKSDLVYISSNPDSKKEKIISAVYLKVLKKQLSIL